VSCWPWSHSWSKWEVSGEGKMLRTYDSITGEPLQADAKPTVVGRYIDQFRQCHDCGMIQLRREKS
jgi:hypothetical protein